MTESALAAEVWTYLGIRADSKSKRVHAWRDPAGHELLYSDSGTFVIAGLYDVKVDRSNGGCRRTKPVYTGEYSPDVDRTGLWAADRAARTRLAAAARERKDGAQSALDEALEPLLAVAAKLRSGDERDALAAYVIRRIHQAWR